MKNRSIPRVQVVVRFCLAVATALMCVGVPTASARECPQGTIAPTALSSIPPGCASAGLLVAVTADFTPAIPAPGDSAGAYSSSATGGWSAGILTTEGGQVGLRVQGAEYGSAEAVRRLRPQVVSPDPSVVLSGCGSSASYLLAGTAWAAGSAMFPWYYNAASQPVGTPYTPLSLIQTGFANAVADSSSCGMGATGATDNYRGATSSNTANHDGRSVVGWATFSDPSTLGMAWWWSTGGFTNEVDIRFDSSPASPFHMSHYLPVPSGYHDFISLATHEVLHGYGLLDLKSPPFADDGQVMWESMGLGAGSDRRTK